jgi:myosin heavy subunit
VQNLSKNKSFDKSRFAVDEEFIIKHYAGAVTYVTRGFLEKVP